MAIEKGLETRSRGKAPRWVPVTVKCSTADDVIE
jgi:hypothetical protein